MNEGKPKQISLTKNDIIKGVIKNKSGIAIKIEPVQGATKKITFTSLIAPKKGKNSMVSIKITNKNKQQFITKYKETPVPHDEYYFFGSDKNIKNKVEILNREKNTPFIIDKLEPGKYIKTLKILFSRLRR